MPITTTELAGGIAILIGVPAIAYALNRTRQGLGWAFVGAVVVIAVVGNVIERVVS